MNSHHFFPPLQDKGVVLVEKILIQREPINNNVYKVCALFNNQLIVVTSLSGKLEYTVFDPQSLDLLEKKSYDTSVFFDVTPVSDNAFVTTFYNNFTSNTSILNNKLEICTTINRGRYDFGHRSMAVIAQFNLLISCPYSADVGLFDLGTLECKGSFEIKDETSSIAAFESGKILFGYIDGTVGVWTLKANAQNNKLSSAQFELEFNYDFKTDNQYRDKKTDIFIQPNGTVITRACPISHDNHDSLLQLWKLENKEAICLATKEIKSPNDNWKMLSDGSLLCINNNEQCCFCIINGITLESTYYEMPFKINYNSNNFTVLPTDQIAVVSKDNKLKIIELPYIQNYKKPIITKEIVNTSTLFSHVPGLAGMVADYVGCDVLPEVKSSKPSIK